MLSEPIIYFNQTVLWRVTYFRMLARVTSIYRYTCTIHYMCSHSLPFPQGLQGDKGVQGEEGDKGHPGSQGESGFPGEVGRAGPQGGQGDTGDDGAVVSWCSYESSYNYTVLLITGINFLLNLIYVCVIIMAEHTCMYVYTVN